MLCHNCTTLGGKLTWTFKLFTECEACAALEQSGCFVGNVGGFLANLIPLPSNARLVPINVKNFSSKHKIKVDRIQSLEAPLWMSIMILN